MVWPILSFQESFDHFSYKKANLVWSDSALFSFRRIWAKNKVAILSFDQSKSLDQRTIQFNPYYLLQLFWWFSWKLSFWFHLCLLSNSVQKTVWVNLCDSTFVCDSVLFLIFLVLKLNFNIAYYSATSLCCTSFMTRLLETFGNEDVEETTLLDWTASWNFTM